MIKKLLLQILNNQKEIRSLLDTRTLEKSKKYDEIVKNLECVRLKVKKISKVTETDGLPQVIVLYEPITETITSNGDGGIESSSQFKAINLLDLTSYADMRKVSAAIEDIKK